MLSIFKRSCCAMVGCYNINKLKWREACESLDECELSSLGELVQSGLEQWRLDPVATATRYLSSPNIPCEYKSVPAYLIDRKCYNGKTYVALGFSCLCDIVVELSTLACDNDIYMVCRYAYAK